MKNMERPWVQQKSPGFKFRGFFVSGLFQSGSHIDSYMFAYAGKFSQAAKF